MPEVQEAVCLYDYEPDGKGMIGFSAGDRIGIVEKTNDEWWLALKNGEQGWVPAAYVQLPVQAANGRRGSMS